MKFYLKLYSIALFFVVSCKTQFCVEYQNQPSAVNYSSSVADSQMNYLMLNYSSEYNATMTKVVGYTSQALEKGNPEGDLGKLVSDLLFDTILKSFSEYNSKNSFVFINNGGLRVALPKGEITNGKIYELMPFENYVNIVQLKGSELKNDFINYLIQKKGQPLSYNVVIKILNGKLIHFEVGGEEIVNDQNYFIFTNDYLASGGDNILFFKDKIKKELPNLKFRDLILGFFSKHTSNTNPAVVNKIERLIIE